MPFLWIVLVNLTFFGKGQVKNNKDLLLLQVILLQKRNFLFQSVLPLVHHPHELVNLCDERKYFADGESKMSFYFFLTRADVSVRFIDFLHLLENLVTGRHLWFRCRHDLPPRPVIGERY